MPIRADELQGERRAEAVQRPPPATPLAPLGLSPAVTEGRIVLDLGKVGVDELGTCFESA